jgi:4-amino-4-deoxy-L-arabinose transferase-like glycosyltransferase
MKSKKHNRPVSRDIVQKHNEDNSYTTWILLFCVIAFICYVRIRLFSTPLERDEGEYAYMGQLLLKGIPPFKEAFNMKLPGTSILYACIMFLFGETVVGIHLGLLIINSISILIIYLLGRRWLSPKAGIITAITFGLLTISHVLLGFAAHATHFVIFFALWGCLMLDMALEHMSIGRLVLSGVLFGCAFLMKQPGIFFFLFGGAVLFIVAQENHLSKRLQFRFAFSFVIGFLLPLLVIITYITFAGTFNNFWFWIIRYSYEYGTELSLGEGRIRLSRMLEAFWDFFPYFCIVICVGFLLIITRKAGLAVRKIQLLIVFSILALLPGWYFRNHYFILLTPICSLLVGYSFFSFQAILKKHPHLTLLSILVPIFIVGENIISREYYYFSAPPSEIVKTVYNGVFSESEEIASFIASHTTPDERIAILGSEPQIFFYSRRQSVSGHIYMFGLMEHQPYARVMQEELIADIERAKPKYIVFYEVATSWNADEKSDQFIIGWSRQYLRRYYHPAGFVDIVPRQTTTHTLTYETRYFFGDNMKFYTPISQDAVIIYERQNGS